MILEIAEIFVKAEFADRFEAASRAAVGSTLSKAEGFLDLELLRCDEDPNCFVLMVHWETKAHHTETFRASPLFAAWREAVGPYFSEPPKVRHFHSFEKIN